MTKLLTSIRQWTIHQWVRLIIGGSIIAAAFIDHQPLIALMGLWFVYQAIFNVSCAGGNCAVNYQEEKTRKKEIV